MKFSIFIGITVFLVILLNSINFARSHNIEVPPAIELAVSDDSYVVMIDAGSSGCKVFLYHLTKNTTTGNFIVREVKDKDGKTLYFKVSPGLGAYPNKPKEAAESLKPLLSFIEKHIPENKIANSSLMLLATEGIRMLTLPQQQEIIEHIRNTLPSMTKLKVNGNNVQILSGKWEGLYTWVSANYMLDKIGGDLANKKQTVGIIDMGGASLQVVVEIENHQNAPEKVLDMVDMGKFGVRYLLAKSFKGYGMHEGLMRYERKIKHHHGEQKQPHVSDACLPQGHKIDFFFKEFKDFKKNGTGNWEKCYEIVNSIVDDDVDTKCDELTECKNSFIRKTFSNIYQLEWMGFQQVAHGFKDILGIEKNYNHSELLQKTSEFCKKPWDKMKHMAEMCNCGMDDYHLSNQCFISAWTLSILHTALKFDKKEHKFNHALEINGQQVNWALGSIIYHSINMGQKRPAVSRAERVNMNRI